MELKDMITRRKSVRSYTGQPVDGETLKKIEEFLRKTVPLFPEIRTSVEIVSREQVRCMFPWVTPQLAAIFSEEKDGYLENAGFVLQQLDLYLQTLGLGACWLGMGRLSDPSIEGARTDGMKFVIVLAFGYPKGDGQRKSLSEFKRKSLSEISDQADSRLEPARLAPSSVNSQPWYFAHDGEKLHVYCVRQGLLKNKAPNAMNRMDIGIALSHLYLTAPDTFRFFQTNAPERKGYAYIGSITL